MLSSQEDSSDSMPEDWVDEGPGPKVAFCEPIYVYDTTPRERAWRRRQRELGRTPTGDVPYTLYSALELPDGTWEGPYFMSSVDKYSDSITNDWEEDQVKSLPAMVTDPPLVLLLGSWSRTTVGLEQWGNGLSLKLPLWTKCW